MVFAGSGEEESMAMGPERSKPLHNFMMPCLKWGNQRHLRCMKLPTDTGDRQSPPVTGKTEFNNARDSDKKKTRITKTRIPDDDDVVVVDDVNGNGIDAVREKLMLDLKTEADRMKDKILGKEVAVAEENEDAVVAAAAAAVTVLETGERSSAATGGGGGERPWNLRTRRAPCKSPVGGDSGKGIRIEERKPAVASPSRTVSGAAKLRGSPEKVKFSLSLSKKEIEEDFMLLVGHRPPRRPKKRPRNVQRQLDTIFPGMWLSEVTADSYKVPETPENNGKR